MRGEGRENITYWRQRYRSRERELEITPDMEEKWKTVAREEEMTEPKGREEMAFNSLWRALSELAKGQKDMLEEIKSLHHPPGEVLIRNYRGMLQSG